MKTVRTVADLNALALRTGASVSLDGKRFNAEGERAAAPLRKPPVSMKPTPAPEPPPAAPAPATDPALRELIATLADSQRTIAEALTQALAGKAAPEEVSQANTVVAVVPVAAAAPVFGPWEISFTDDVRGLPTRAAASNGDRTLNFNVTRKPDGSLDRVVLDEPNEGAH
jgi:hypothetical protein